ncbi:FKBP-type peptidyl-prolyl cis-trans isomerase [Micromonospora endolithica]|uniref:Peptidyl-prolyl cis-trans isomerase n=1 Tax=Micromonospora endolithica TaxID=230091 RepID=A0A3A9ZM89_9ACTN|nr:FKBP-type peptidyl-prolyl cis-trans isomerase [Micromonospora endolithica]RKN48466.1 peptidylprolyl isomerase [Micromonospora endolithica]TWJ24450.1 peptidylprolyl isomerase [Micromonospora endolithica]
MSERTQNRAQKSERRLAAQLAEQKAAEAKRRRQAWAGGLAGVAVVAVLITVFVIVGRGGDDDAADQAGSAPTGAPSASASASAAPAGAGAPLPEGADPALNTQPTVEAGEGELSKLVVTPLIKGTGPAVKKGQTITTNYVGVFYADGKEFDSSWSRGEPASFPIGVGQVIPGWDQGLVGVNVGSRVQLDIPAELAYGKDASGGRPAGPLRFVVDILAAQ